MRNRKYFCYFSTKNICCGYSKEPSQWDGSFEQPKHMLKNMSKKILTILHRFFFVFLNLCTKLLFVVKPFSLERLLKRHQKRHTGKKAYDCVFCGKSYAEAGSLKLHLRSHTGERPFECDTCGISFTQGINLIRHQRIHTGEKPYKCGTCDKAFTRNANLKDHQRKHFGEEPY